MTAPGFVLVLEGPAGVGKGATIDVLQRRWPDVRPGPLVAAGIQRMLESLGPARERWLPLVQRRDRPDAQPADRVAWGPLGRELFVAMHRAAATWAVAGFDVVIDHVLLDQPTVADLADALEGLPTLHIGLTCDPDELARRQEERGAPAGRAVAELAATRDVAARDVVVDTTHRTVEDVAEVVLRHVREATGA